MIFCTAAAVVTVDDDEIVLNHHQQLVYVIKVVPDEIFKFNLRGPQAFCKSLNSPY